jgi:hypothetical protein
VKSAGRTIGLLLLVQLVGLILPFLLLLPITTAGFPLASPSQHFRLCVSTAPGWRSGFWP